MQRNTQWSWTSFMLELLNVYNHWQNQTYIAVIYHSNFSNSIFMYVYTLNRTLGFTTSVLKYKICQNIFYVFWYIWISSMHLRLKLFIVFDVIVHTYFYYVKLTICEWNTTRILDSNIKPLQLTKSKWMKNQMVKRNIQNFLH